MKKCLIVIFALTCLCFQCNTSQTGYGNITVIDNNHQPVVGATVTMEDHSSNIIGSGTCDANGIYLYEQSNPGEQILEVVVDSPDDTEHGAGIIRILPGETTELTIMIE